MICIEGNHAGKTRKQSLMNAGTRQKASKEPFRSRNITMIIQDSHMPGQRLASEVKLGRFRGKIGRNIHAKAIEVCFGE
jgi:hypothetical protein